VFHLVPSASNGGIEPPVNCSPIGQLIGPRTIASVLIADSASLPLDFSTGGETVLNEATSRNEIEAGLVIS
jgi:hypothetical protein